MLSIGKPPPDLPCACEELIPPLNSDERASPSPQLPDLTPNFSIRNYVFAARSKDISTNWPFSSRNLQLCLKHGVKDPLPPFQSLDNVRSQSFPRSSVETSSSLEKEISRRNSAEEPLRLNSDDDNTRSNDVQADNNFPCMTTSFSPLEIESVPTNRLSNNNSVSVERHTLLGTSVEKEVAGPTVSRKTETAARSTEPTPKWSAGSKLIRHRIKPRKTRLMVDIYETARPCTLEDLDRRNGSNWATGTSVPSQDTAEEKSEKVAPVNPDEDVGAVYIDSNGTKLRILSRFSDCQPSSSTAGEALGPRKCLKGKGNKVLLSRKKKKRRRRKQNAQKHHKYLKLVSQGKDFSSHKARPHNSQDFCGQEKYDGGRADIEDARMLVSRSQGSLQPSDNGTLKQWACSKRSGPSKKVKGKDRHPALGCNEDLPVETGRSCFANNLISDGDHSDSSEDTRNGGGLGVPVIKGETSGKRKLRSPLFYGGADGNVEGSKFPPMKRRESQSSDVFKPTGGCVFHGSIETSISSIAYGKSSKHSSMSPTKVERFSRTEKKVLSVCSLRRPKLNDAKRDSTPGRSERRFMEELDEEDQVDELDPSPSLTRSYSGGFGQDTRKTSALQEPRYFDSDEGKNTESSISLSADQSEKLNRLDSVMNKGQDQGDDGDGDIGAFELHSKSVSEDNDLNFSEYLNQGTPIENRRIHARGSTEIYKGGLCDIEGPTFPDIVEEDVGDGANRQDSDVNMDLDTQVGQEYEVERILIPGPPGSFLPSPGALGSEEFPGNSSLTTSRVQSSQEQQELVDGDSSDSPVSATSTVSNSAPAGSEKCVDLPVSAGPPPPLEEKSLSGFSSDGGNAEPLVLNAASSPQPSTMGVTSERKIIERGPLILKNDDQPCCCQRKERSSQGIVPNYQESQLLRRRNLNSLTAIGLGKRLNRSLNATSIPGEGRLEMLPRSASQDNESKMTRSASVPVTSKCSTDNAAKVSDRGDCDAVTPSVSNPVLRLMGKNLMVVNKEENAATPLGHPQSAGTWNNNPSSSQVSRVTGVSYSSVPVSSSGLRPALSNKLTAVMEPPTQQPGMSSNWYWSGYSDGSCYFPSQPPRSNALVPDSRDLRPMKEIIIIDDASEDEITDMPASMVRRGGGSKERQAAVTPVVSFPMKATISYDPRLVGTHPFNHPSQDPSFFSQVPISRRAGSSPIGVRWCSSSEVESHGTSDAKWACRHSMYLRMVWNIDPCLRRSSLIRKIVLASQLMTSPGMWNLCSIVNFHSIKMVMTISPEDISDHESL
ncbi:hypothetical protein CRG98_024905 [Punica granatum]|uniref:Uncharacterized protein n=1 Tax=Punica granatum TaxID=22663 RepID=A0A2I0JEM2_PUNGR|nr:hypothetical protein CRG98_024905 [Punica granatum]